MPSAISIQDVSKRYRLGEISRGQLLADIHRWWVRRKARRMPDTSSSETEPSETGDFWALKDISVEISKGETVAIIGANGAGKSTLLKIVSRITAPTTGLVRIEGRVGSLLEVGTGFHPELTGRDNVFLNGAILGMSRDEVKRKFDEIVTFAGSEQFIDTPVKRYSSGMYVRLAFSVAAFLEPEILIIDEVLSVGDQQFQDQCIRRIEEIVHDGRTLLFVSHGAGLIQRVCRRAILLQHGQMVFDGDVGDALEAYKRSTIKEVNGEESLTPPDDEPSTHELVDNPPSEEKPLSNESPSEEAPDNDRPSEEPPDNDPGGSESPIEKPVSCREWPDLSTAPGDDVVKLEAIRVVNANRHPVENLLTTQAGIVELEYVVLQGVKYLQPDLVFIDELGNRLFWTADTNPSLRRFAMETGRYKSSMVIPADFLAPGRIFIDVGVGQIVPKLETHAYVSKAISFNVIDDFSEESIRFGYKGVLSGMIRPRMQWMTRRRDNG